MVGIAVINSKDAKRIGTALWHQVTVDYFVTSLSEIAGYRHKIK